MMPPDSLKKIHPDEQDFITTLQRALVRPNGSDLQEPSTLFGAPPLDLEDRLKVFSNRTQADRERLLDIFIKQAELVHMRVILVQNVDRAGLAIRQLIDQTQPEWGERKKSVMAWQHPLIDQLNLKNNLATDDISLFISQTESEPDPREREEFRNHLIQSYIGITSADFCVAESAALVMRTRPNHPRAVSLVPSIHVAVITLDQIIENLAELYFRLKWDPKEQKKGLSNCLTFISGPSKTGDIELVMVQGAHGPRQLIVYVITDHTDNPPT